MQRVAVAIRRKFGRNERLHRSCLVRSNKARGSLKSYDSLICPNYGFMDTTRARKSFVVAPAKTKPDASDNNSLWLIYS